MGNSLDTTDKAILGALDGALRPSISALARAVSVARGTVHARMERLQATGVIRGFSADLDAEQSGFPVRAFTTVAISQGQLDNVLVGLGEIPEVLEAHVVTGRGDLLLIVAARSNDDLHRVLQIVASISQVSELSTQLALASPISRRLTNLLSSSGPESSG